jgi:transposase
LDEVISVVARRRRWTLEQKLALVEEVSRPGSSVAAVADRQGVSRSLLFEWRRQIREGTMPGVVRADAAPALVPVRIVEDAPPKEKPRQPMPSRRSAERAGKSAAMVEVVLRNGRMLRVSEAIAPEVLDRLAAVLDG